MMLQVRGVVLESILLNMRMRLSDAERKSFRHALDPALLPVLDTPVTLRGWYPVSVLTGLMEACAASLPEAPERTYWRIGRQSCDDTLTSVYRLMSRFSSPEFILRRAVRLWNDYYDGGDFEVLESLPESGRIRISEAGFPHPSLCHRIGGWIERAVELSGGREVVVEHPVCTFAGGATEEWWARWRI